MATSNNKGANGGKRTRKGKAPGKSNGARQEHQERERPPKKYLVRRDIGGAQVWFDPRTTREVEESRDMTNGRSPRRKKTAEQS